MRKNLLTIKKMRKDAIAAREMRKKNDNNFYNRALGSRYPII